MNNPLNLSPLVMQPISSSKPADEAQRIQFLNESEFLFHRKATAPPSPFCPFSSISGRYSNSQQSSNPSSRKQTKEEDREDENDDPSLKSFTSLASRVFKVR